MMKTEVIIHIISLLLLPSHFIEDDEGEDEDEDEDGDDDNYLLDDDDDEGMRSHSLIN